MTPHNPFLAGLSLMVKYVENTYNEEYTQTLGVNFMEKTISIRNTEITFSIWDLGGQKEFVNMLPLVCNDAVAILFMFDLSRKATLNSVKVRAPAFCPLSTCLTCSSFCLSLFSFLFFFYLAHAAAATGVVQAGQRIQQDRHSFPDWHQV